MEASLVAAQMTTTSEARVAVWTAEWLLSSVDALVDGETSILSEGLAADVALEALFSLVHRAHVMV